MLFSAPLHEFRSHFRLLRDPCHCYPWQYSQVSEMKYLKTWWKLITVLLHSTETLHSVQQSGWHGKTSYRNKSVFCHTVTDLPFILSVVVNISIRKLVYGEFITGTIKQLHLQLTWQTTFGVNSRSFSIALKTTTT